jgi:hypothetical protein
MLAVEAGLRHGAIEEASGRSDEGPPLPVFLITRLFPDKCHRRAHRTLAQDGARGPGNERLRAFYEGVQLIK